MRNTIKIFLGILVSSLFFGACQDKSYPCPGTGKASPSALSAFDDGGKPKNREKYQDNGLINKKSPKKIHKK